MKDKKIAIIGLGYVGLPLAVAFAEKYPVVGLDINTNRVEELKKGIDATLEVENNHLSSVLVPNSIKLDETGSKGLFCTTATSDISNCNIFIVTVPTPTDKHNRPVLTPMIKASETVAKVLKKGDVVIYESTVYPGVTEDEMVPILEAILPSVSIQAIKNIQ
jgi:UDP-N-acetyl-D-galactosamine dehydrogenase